MSFSSQLRMIAHESINKRRELNMIIAALVISLLAGYVIRYDMFGVYENAKIGFFILTCCGMWMGMFDSILCICDKRAVLERDKASGLKPVPFMFAVVVYQAFHSLLQTLVMCVITWALIEWPADTVALLGPAPLEYFFTIFLIVFAAQMLGLAVSALMKSSEKALTFAPFLLIYELIMSETIFGLPAWLEPLRNTTIVRWGMDSLGTIYDIDALPWRAEFKIQDVLGQVADSAGQWASDWGLDPSGIRESIMGYQIDPSVMGVSHDLAEYTATAGCLEATWLALGILCLVGIAIAIAGFCRCISSR